MRGTWNARNRRRGDASAEVVWGHGTRRCGARRETAKRSSGDLDKGAASPARTRSSVVRSDPWLLFLLRLRLVLGGDLLLDLRRDGLVVAQFHDEGTLAAGDAL